MHDDAHQVTNTHTHTHLLGPSPAFIAVAAVSGCAIAIHAQTRGVTVQTGEHIARLLITHTHTPRITCTCRHERSTCNFPKTSHTHTQSSANNVIATHLAAPQRVAFAVLVHGVIHAVGTLRGGGSGARGACEASGALAHVHAVDQGDVAVLALWVGETHTRPHTHARTRTISHSPPSSRGDPQLIPIHPNSITVHAR